MMAAECTVIMLLVVGRIKVNSGPEIDGFVLK